MPLAPQLISLAEFYTYPCSAALNSVEFVFTGQHFSINLADFNLGKLFAFKNPPAHVFPAGMTERDSP